MRSVQLRHFVAAAGKTSSGGIIFYLLLLCEDIPANPSPICHSCTVCDKSIKDNQKRVLCDLCGNWSHARCVGIDAHRYSNLCKAEDINWQCPSCLFNALPYHDVVMDASINVDSSVVSDSDLSQHDLPFVSDVLSVPSCGVRLIHHNVQGLLSKMPEITQWLHIYGSLPTILCCSETWLRPNDSVGQIPGYDFYCSPDHFWSNGTGRVSRLPGSCIFVSETLLPDHPIICSEIEDSCQNLNVSCCFVTCKFHHLAVVCIYRSPSTFPHASLQELGTYASG